MGCKAKAAHPGAVFLPSGPHTPPEGAEVGEKQGFLEEEAVMPRIAIFWQLGRDTCSPLQESGSLLGPQ